MFGLFKKPKWRPVVMLGQVVAEVRVGSDTDEIMITMEEIIHVLQRRIDVLNQQADARFKDVNDAFDLIRNANEILRSHDFILEAVTNDTLAKLDVVVGVANKADKDKKKMIKSSTPKKVTKKKAKK